MSLFNRYHKKYDAWYDKNEFAYLSELEALKKVMPKFGKGLEIGTGTGRFAAPLGITLGIDPSMEMLEIAQKRGVNTRWGVGEDIPFWQETFDYVAIIITLCFVKKPLGVLEESWRVLEKGGRIILGIVDKKSFLGKFYRSRKNLFYEQANFFDVQYLSNLLISLGFKQISYYQTLYDIPEKITSVQEPRKGYGQGGFVVITGKKK